MFRSRSQIFWYLTGGLLLLLAGVVVISGATFPYALPVLLVAAGVIIIAAGLFRIRPTFPAFVVFLVGIIVLGLAASPYGFRPATEIHELTTSQATVDEATVLCSVSTGNIRVSFTSNETLIYRIVFTKYFSFLTQPKVNFNDSVVDDKLTVNASSTTVDVDITLNQNLKSSLSLTTSTGNIRAEVPTTASKVEKMTLTTTTGNVWMNITNTSQLQNLIAKTTTGNVEAYVKSSFQTRDANVQLSTTTGRVKLNLDVIYIESDIKASTTTGNVNVNNIQGFSIISQTRTSFHARTPEYGLSSFKKLDVSASTTTGNVDISAVHGQPLTL